MDSNSTEVFGGERLVGVRSGVLSCLGPLWSSLVHDLWGCWTGTSVGNGWIKMLRDTWIGYMTELEFVAATKLRSQSSLFGEWLFQVIGLSHEVNVESHKLFHLFYLP